MSKKRCAIFISGSGTNMQNIVKSIKKGVLKRTEVGFIFSDNLEAKGLERADKLKVKKLAFHPKEFESKLLFEKALIRILRAEKIDFVVLAGYMRLVGPTLLTAYKNRILNIHPALLPSFPGGHGIVDAFNYGVKCSGVTVHYVDDGVDTGPVIAQEPVEIKTKDTFETFERRIHKVEYSLYPKAIQLYVDGKAPVFRRKKTKG